MAPQENSIIVDVETTGGDTRRDQVIELAIQFGPEKGSKTWLKRFKPTKKIHPMATRVHGITDADLKDCPPIRQFLGEISLMLESADIIIGYNVGFDLEMLQSEFDRHKSAFPALEKKIILDPLQLWRKCEPRGLEHAVRRFAKREHDKAHSAAGDVEATGEVLLGMMKAFKLEGKSLSEVADYIDPSRRLWVGPSHHIQWAEELPVFGFGKNKGKSIAEMAAEKDDYLSWVLDTDFPDHVKGIVRSAIEMEQTEFVTWVRVTYSAS